MYGKFTGIAIMHKLFCRDVGSVDGLSRRVQRGLLCIAQAHGQHSRLEPRRAHALAAMAMSGFLATFPAFAQVAAEDAVASERTPDRSMHIPKSSLRPSFGFSLRDVGLPAYWQTAATSGAPDFAIGYQWRDIRLKRTGRFAVSTERLRIAPDEHSWIDSGPSRLSFSASPNWTWRIGRDTLGDVDQLANQNTRRSTISATYVQPLEQGDWQTTLAWGRRARRWNEPVTGYLVESVLRFHNSHSVFGTLEQVGSDDPARANAPPQQQLFKMNKLTVGYFHHVEMVAPARIDVGGFVTRHLVPSGMASSYGSTPTIYMMFIRVKLD
jgi:hypothetical protein